MNDPLDDRLRRLRAAALPAEMSERLAMPPVRAAGRRSVIVRVCFAAAAAAALVALVALVLHSEPPPAVEAAPVLADTSSRRVEDVRPLAVLTEGRRAWELVEVKWVDESTLVATGGHPLAVQATNSHRTIVPVEILLD